MWNRISLRGRIFFILATLVFITMIGGVVMVWYTYQMEEQLTSIIEKDLKAFQAAEALETSLVNQKGFVSYYFIDGDQQWLKQLGKCRQIFNERLNKAKKFAKGKVEKKTVNRIESEYTLYIKNKDRVIAYYKAGERKTGAELHREVRDRYFEILSLCEQYKNIHTERIIKARKESGLQAKRLRVIAVAAIGIVFFLGVFLAFVMINHILGPVQRLTLAADREGIKHPAENEIKALSRSVGNLIEDVDQVHGELEKSREHLLQAEKMALVGKLAAGMAHSIRNPFTSVKMRLFSLDRSLELSDTQKEDFEVISQEIHHIDNIVQNFLEFSRPPKLQMQQISPSVVVDLVVQLLEHRLKSYDVTIKIIRRQPLPEIQADPEQLKEVLVNIVMNACEAMERGGKMVIHEEETFLKPQGRVAVIRLSDNGPGIAESIKEKIFQPFFTTKEEGTGLGLSIATRIMEEHKGWIDVTSKEGEGTTFVITLPAKESDLE
jgi:signal transduction histidine kinase